MADPFSIGIEVFAKTDRFDKALQDVQRTIETKALSMARASENAGQKMGDQLMFGFTERVKAKGEQLNFQFAEMGENAAKSFEDAYAKTVRQKRARDAFFGVRAEAMQISRDDFMSQQGFQREGGRYSSGGGGLAGDIAGGVAGHAAMGAIGRGRGMQGNDSFRKAAARGTFGPQVGRIARVGLVGAAAAGAVGFVDTLFEQINNQVKMPKHERSQLQMGKDIMTTIGQGITSVAQALPLIGTLQDTIGLALDPALGSPMETERAQQRRAGEGGADAAQNARRKAKQQMVVDARENQEKAIAQAKAEVKAAEEERRRQMAVQGSAAQGFGKDTSDKIDRDQKAANEILKAQEKAAIKMAEERIKNDGERQAAIIHIEHEFDLRMQNQNKLFEQRKMQVFDERQALMEADKERAAAQAKMVEDLKEKQEKAAARRKQAMEMMEEKRAELDLKAAQYTETAQTAGGAFTFSGTDRKTGAQIMQRTQADDTKIIKEVIQKFPELLLQLISIAGRQGGLA